MQKALFAIKSFGLFVLILVLGPTALVGCIAYVLLRDLRWVYALSLGFAVLWFAASYFMDGIKLGSILHMRPHASIKFNEQPVLLLNLLKLLLFAIFGIKIGYALRDAHQKAWGKRRATPSEPV